MIIAFRGTASLLGSQVLHIYDMLHIYDIYEEKKRDTVNTVVLNGNRNGEFLHRCSQLAFMINHPVNNLHPHNVTRSLSEVLS